MPTLLLRLCGPMQSWGTRSRFVERDTELEPSKSGVFGLLCAAAGVPRSEPIPAPWLRLRMGVRVEVEGRMANDYHTSGGAYDVGIARADGGHLGNAVLSNRHYLADADFLVGLEGDDPKVLAGIQAALRSPRWQLCLGRKSFVPSLPVYLPYAGGLRDGGLEDGFRSEPPPPTPGALPRRRAQSPGGLRAVIEREPGATEETRMDQPFADSFATRRFGPRWVETTFLKPPGDTAE